MLYPGVTREWVDKASVARKGDRRPWPGPFQGQSAAAWATYKSSRPRPIRSQAMATTAGRSARRGGAHGGAACGHDAGRKGDSARHLARRMPAGKGSCRLCKGSGGTVRVREEG
ncbi:hypothetical protein BHM03_00058689 [Ensete ventricosum]|nr:hypothetical protein BHM03_00058689 [Ensete ventricosum]